MKRESGFCSQNLLTKNQLYLKLYEVLFYDSCIIGKLSKDSIAQV